MSLIVTPLKPCLSLRVTLSILCSSFPNNMAHLGQDNFFLFTLTKRRTTHELKITEFFSIKHCSREKVFFKELLCFASNPKRIMASFFSA